MGVISFNNWDFKNSNTFYKREGNDSINKLIEERNKQFDTQKIIEERNKQFDTQKIIEERNKQFGKQDDKSNKDHYTSPDDSYDADKDDTEKTKQETETEENTETKTETKTKTPEELLKEEEQKNKNFEEARKLLEEREKIKNKSLPSSSQNEKNTDNNQKTNSNGISNRTIAIIALLVIIIAIITFIICRFSKKNKQRRYKMFTRNIHGHAINITPDKVTVTMTTGNEENIDETSNLSSNNSDNNMIPEKDNSSKISEVPLSSDPVVMTPLPYDNSTATTPSSSAPTINNIRNNTNGYLPNHYSNYAINTSIPPVPMDSSNQYSVNYAQLNQYPLPNVPQPQVYYSTPV